MKDKVAGLYISIDSDEAAKAKKHLQELEMQGKKTERATDDLGRSSAKTGKAFLGMSKGALKASGAIAALAAAGAALKKIVSVNREFDVLNAQLVTSTGSAENAAKAFKALEAFAARTPTDLAQVTDSFVKLVNFGLDPSERALTSYGNTASAMGKTLNQLIEAVADAATGEFERLKEFGIKSKSEGDQVSFTFRGVTTTIGKNAAEIEGYLRDLGENEFAGAMQQRVDTLDGAVSNLGDAWNTLIRTIGEGPIGEAIEATVRKGIEALESLEGFVDRLKGKFDFSDLDPNQIFKEYVKVTEQIEELENSAFGGSTLRRPFIEQQKKRREALKEAFQQLGEVEQQTARLTYQQELLNTSYEKQKKSLEGLDGQAWVDAAQYNLVLQDAVHNVTTELEIQKYLLRGTSLEVTKAADALAEFKIVADSIEQEEDPLSKVLGVDLLTRITESDTALQKMLREAKDAVAEFRGEGLLASIFDVTGFADRQEDQLAALEDWYQIQRAVVLENEELTEQQRQELLIRLREEFQTRLATSNVSQYGDQVAAYNDFQSNLLTLAQSGNKKAAALFKATAIANTIVKTYESATSAYAAMASIPYVGPALGAAAAGVAIAAGLANVQAIKSQSVGSYAQGGIIGGTSYAGDNLQINANSREMVLTTNQQRKLFEVANGRASTGTASSSAEVTVNVHNAPAGTRTESRKDASGATTIDVFIEQVKSAIAADIHTGNGSIPAMMERSFNLQRG